jgi:glycosyltransferase involved in cell wall biosynthesis
LEAYRAGRSEEAEAVADEMVRAFPNCADGYELKGVLYFQGRRHDDAAGCFRRALALNPNSADTWNNLGVVLIELKMWGAAGEAFLKTLERNPGHLSAARHLGFVLERLDRPGAAASHYLSLMQRFGPRDDLLEDYIRFMVAQGQAESILESLPTGFTPAVVALLTARSLLEKGDWAGAEAQCVASLGLAGGAWPTPDVRLDYFRAMYYLLVDALQQKGFGKGNEACFRESYFRGIQEAFLASGAQLPTPARSPGKRLAVVIPGFINEHFGPTVLMLGLLIRFVEVLGWEAVLVDCDYSLYNQSLAKVSGVVKLPPGRSGYVYAGREIMTFSPAAANFRERFEEIGRFLMDFSPSVIFTAGTELNPYSDLLAASWPTVVVPMNSRIPFCYGHLYHVISEDPVILESFCQALPPTAELLPYERPFPFVFPLPSSVRNRAEFGLGEDDFVYLTSGLIMGAAFTPEYQRILAEILEQADHARILVVGSTEEEFPWREPRLERWRGTRLVFSTFQPDLRAVLRLADAFLHPPAPRNGGTVRQCFAEGIPVVAARQSGLVQVVPDEDMLDGLEAYRNEAVRLANDQEFREHAVMSSKEINARFEAEVASYMNTMEEAARMAEAVFRRTRDAHFLFAGQNRTHGK